MKFCNLIGQSQVSISRSKPPKRFTTCSKPLVARLPVNDAGNLYKQSTALATVVQSESESKQIMVSSKQIMAPLFPLPLPLLSHLSTDYVCNLATHYVRIFTLTPHTQLHSLFLSAASVLQLLPEEPRRTKRCKQVCLVEGKGQVYQTLTTQYAVSQESATRA